MNKLSIRVFSKILKSMNWKKANTKTVLLLWNSKFPAKIITLSSERVNHNYWLQNITLLKSAVVRDPLSEDSAMILAGNVLFHNNNTVSYVLNFSFFAFPNFSYVVFFHYFSIQLEKLKT